MEKTEIRFFNIFKDWKFILKRAMMNNIEFTIQIQCFEAEKCYFFTSQLFGYRSVKSGRLRLGF